MSPHKCLHCNEEYKTEIGDYHYLESGLDNFWICGVEIYQCACGESAAIPNPMEVHRIMAKCLLMQNSPLTGKEIRFLRKHMVMKAIEFAKRIGVDNSTVSRWENGKETPSDIADRAIRLSCAVRLGYHKEAEELVNEVFPEISKGNLPIPYYLAADRSGHLTCSKGCR